MFQLDFLFFVFFFIYMYICVLYKFKISVTFCMISYVSINPKALKNNSLIEGLCNFVTLLTKIKVKIREFLVME